MGRSKELSPDHRGAIIAAHKSGKGYKTIAKDLQLHVSTVRQVIYKYQEHGVTTSLRRSGRPRKITGRAERKMVREVTDNPRLTSRDLQKSLSSKGIEVHDSTIRKRLAQNNLHGRVARKKPLLSKKNIAARLKFAQEHIGKPQEFWNNILWTDESKIELFGQNQNRFVWRRPSTAYQQKHLIPTVKHGGGRVLVWGCFAAAGPGQLTIIEGIMNSEVYQNILEENVKPSVKKLKLRRNWMLQQDNDPKHASKSTSEWLKKKKFNVLEWPSQSPDLNPIEMLWSDLKKAVHQRKPSNLGQLKQFCREEWPKISPARCERLVSTYKKRLQEVIAAKGGATSY